MTNSQLILGTEVVVPKYGVGLITEIGPSNRTGLDNLPEWIGVTPYVVGYQMNFAPHNVKILSKIP